MGRITIQQNKDEAAESRGHYSYISFKADTDRSPRVLKDKCSLLIIYSITWTEQTALRSLIYATLHYLSKRPGEGALHRQRCDSICSTHLWILGERVMWHIRKIHAKTQIKTPGTCKYRANKQRKRCHETNENADAKWHEMWLGFFYDYFCLRAVSNLFWKVTRKRTRTAWLHYWIGRFIIPKKVQLHKASW